MEVDLRQRIVDKIESSCQTNFPTFQDLVWSSFFNNFSLEFQEKMACSTGLLKFFVGDDEPTREGDFNLGNDHDVDAVTKAVLASAFEYVGDAPALIGLLYQTRAVYGTCPSAIPSSPLGSRMSDGSTVMVISSFDYPGRGMKSLNIMLRHSYNYFNSVAKHSSKARSIRDAIASIFADMAVPHDRRTGRYHAGSSKMDRIRRLYDQISTAIIRLPPTPAERERIREAEREAIRKAAEAEVAAAAAAEAERKAEQERVEAARIAELAKYGLTPDDCW